MQHARYTLLYIGLLLYAYWGYDGLLQPGDSIVFSLSVGWSISNKGMTNELVLYKNPSTDSRPSSKLHYKQWIRLINHCLFGITVRWKNVLVSVESCATVTYSSDLLTYKSTSSDLITRLYHSSLFHGRPVSRSDIWHSINTFHDK